MVGRQPIIIRLRGRAKETAGMNMHPLHRRAQSRSLWIRLLIVPLIVAAAIQFSPGVTQARGTIGDDRAVSSSVRQVKLDADRSGQAGRRDARLVNPWGITLIGADPIWIADNGRGIATEYNG